MSKLPIAAGLLASVGLSVLAASPAWTQEAPPAAADAAQAYTLLNQNNPAAAAEAAGRALAAEPGRLDYRLLLADALLRAGRPAEAYDALSPVSDLQDFRVQSRLAQAAQRSGRASEATEAYGRAAALADTAQTRAYLQREQIAGLVQQGRGDEARAVFDQAWATDRFGGDAPLDVANLAVAVGRDAEAQTAFALANQHSPLTGAQALNAGYSARRAGDDRAAVSYFEQGLDSWPADPGFDDQRRFEIRREIETLSRRWGADASISHGGASVLDSAAAGGDSVTQAGGEIYRRIGGYNDGRPFEAFARVYGTVDSDLGGPTGGDSLQGWIGLRYKPLRDANLILEASRMFALGDQARDDWMLRAAWSAEAGGDLRYDQGSWPGWRLYGDIAHLVDAEQTLGVAEARWGRAFRRGDRDIITPFVGLRGYYDSALAEEFALGAGPGVSWRRWFREGRYAAPASFIEAVLGYQFSLSGDARGEGLHIGLNLHY